MRRGDREDAKYGESGLDNAAAWLTCLGKWFLQIAAGARERDKGLPNKAARRKSTDKKKLEFYLLQSMLTRRMMGIWLGGETPEGGVQVCLGECKRNQRSGLRIAGVSPVRVAKVGEGARVGIGSTLE